MIRVNIDVTKLDKSAFHEGKKGKYADLTLMTNRDGRDQYGNDGFVVQDLGKERRQAGEKGAILGNWKDLDLNPPAGRDRTPADGYRKKEPYQPRDNGGSGPDDSDDIPFRECLYPF